MFPRNSSRGQLVLRFETTEATVLVLFSLLFHSFVSVLDFRGESEFILFKSFDNGELLVFHLIVKALYRLCVLRLTKDISCDFCSLHDPLLVTVTFK